MRAITRARQSCACDCAMSGVISMSLKPLISLSTVLGEKRSSASPDSVIACLHALV